jgi:hypothetical protein
MRKKAYVFSRQMVWSQVARQYLKLFEEVNSDSIVHPRPSQQANVPSLSKMVLPSLRFDHLKSLTDDVGILQHALFNVPARSHGYCTDDNARALIVALLASRYDKSEKYMLAFATRYLAFLHHAYSEATGRFKNFLSYDRRWEDGLGSEDSHGRGILALGRATLLTDENDLLNPVLHLFERALPAALDLRSPRAWAFCLIGTTCYLDRFEGAQKVRRVCIELATRLFDLFREHTSDEWPWPEDIVTYANGALAQALLESGRYLDRSDMVECGLRTLRWLAKVQTDPKGHFVPIGNKGWFIRSGTRARFDQQPIEAQHMADACLTAYSLTGASSWFLEARRCFEWFLGRNDLKQLVCDTATGGCRDGLSADGLNQNQGAESTLSWLHTLLMLHAQTKDGKKPLSTVQFADRRASWETLLAPTDSIVWRN